MDQQKETVTHFRHDEITDSIALQIAELAARSFTTSHRTLKQRIAELFDGRQKQDSVTKSIRRSVITRGNRIVAHAKTFTRTIYFEEVESESQRALNVLALASVCSDPNLRGQGLGALVTQAAFSQIGQGTSPTISLFQTPVPSFYEKLDCRLIDNRFVNRQSETDTETGPWRDDTIMIYPSAHEWHAGVIDLNGPDY